MNEITPFAWLVVSQNEIFFSLLKTCDILANNSSCICANHTSSNQGC